MPRYIEDSTMSIYINGLKDGTRYRESGLVLDNTTVVGMTVYKVHLVNPISLIKTGNRMAVSEITSPSMKLKIHP